ncbi:MAG: metal-dependent hydrolase [Phycisphaerales bacterium]|nr:MAG: metal-dependent hydrolase [Phycisphaerales bacterium]
MCTVLTHTFVALAAGKACFIRKMPVKFWALAVFCSSAPDLDSGLMAWGVPYDAFLGHRGFLHSLAFALLLSVIVVSWAFRREAQWFGRGWWRLLAFFFLLTASHGFLDAFTNGGLGIAFFAPFSNERYFMPWTPIEVSAIGLVGFLRYGGGETLKSELVWVWLPGGVLTAAVILARSRPSRQKPRGGGVQNPRAVDR